MDNKTVVLMPSCYKYRRTWKPFFTLFNRFWNDCPYEIMMGVDIGSYPGIKTIQVGRDLGWASNLIYVLKRIEADRIFLILDDYFIYRQVDGKKIQKLVQLSRNFSVGCLRTTPCPGPTGKWHGSKLLGVLKPNDPYRLSLQSAIWDKKLLLKLLQKGETPWETEIKGTRRASQLSEPFVSVWRGETPIVYEIGILKGKWTENALKLMKKEKISIDGINF